MSRGIGWALGAILLIVLCLWLYNNKISRSTPGYGEVTSLDSKSSPDTRDTPHNPPPSTQPAPPTPAATSLVPPPNASRPAASVPATLPPADTLSPNAPTGMAFGGKGRYQWYRQGNITWRIDTISGATCIDFATMDEWSKSIVYTHGCRNT